MKGSVDLDAPRDRRRAMGGRRGVKGPTPGFSGAESLGGGGGVGAEGSMSCLSATGRGRSRHPYTIQTDIQDPQCVRASTNGTQQGWTNSGWTCVSPWTCLWRGDGTAGSKRERERKPRTKVADKVACKGATHGCRSASHTANGVSDVGLCRWCAEKRRLQGVQIRQLQILGWLPAMPGQSPGRRRAGAGV